MKGVLQDLGVAVASNDTLGKVMSEIGRCAPMLRLRGPDLQRHLKLLATGAPEDLPAADRLQRIAGALEAYQKYSPGLPAVVSGQVGDQIVDSLTKHSSWLCARADEASPSVQSSDFGNFQAVIQRAQATFPLERELDNMMQQSADRLRDFQTESFGRVVTRNLAQVVLQGKLSLDGVKNVVSVMSAKGGLLGDDMAGEVQQLLESILETVILGALGRLL